ncbi:MAG: RNA-binding S4 domain-containing protein [Salinivirgaceae bacterium]|nr:RNA-binding S4 domain-containing protein [Salinivirgaceae bacterium]
MINFKLKSATEGEPYIELNKLLKATQMAENGAWANQLISGGNVKVNGTVDTRKRAKIYKGFVVEVNKNQIQVE